MIRTTNSQAAEYDIAEGICAIIPCTNPITFPEYGSPATQAELDAAWLLKVQYQARRIDEAKAAKRQAEREARIDYHNRLWAAHAASGIDSAGNAVKDQIIPEGKDADYGDMYASLLEAI